MVRMSMLRNRPMICGDQQIGLLQSFSFDQTQKTVQALVIAGGLKGKCIVYPRDVLSITKEWILVSTHEKYNRSAEILPVRFARDTTGALYGKVTDYLIDERTFSVVSLEIMRGYLPKQRHLKIWVFSFRASTLHPDEAIITDPFSTGLI